MSNLRAAGILARERGFPLMVSAVFSDWLAKEQDAFVRFAAEVGADAVAFQNLHHSTPATAKMDAFLKFNAEKIARFTEDAVRAAETAGIDIQFACNTLLHRYLERGDPIAN